MSHFSKDLAIDGIIDDIGAMGDMDVVKALNPSNLSKVSKFDQKRLFGGGFWVLALLKLDEPLNLGSVG